MPYLRWTASPAKNISNGRAGALRGFIQDLAGELPRILILGNSVNKGKKT
jgi:hypothetical protein